MKVTTKDWDAIAALNDTDLYGLLNMMLEESGEKDRFVDKLNSVKSAFGLAKESSKDEALASIKREMSRIEDDWEPDKFRYTVLNAVYRAIAYDSCMPLVLSGDFWQEEIVTEILEKYRDFVERRSGLSGRGSYYSIVIASKEHEGK